MEFNNYQVDTSWTLTDVDHTMDDEIFLLQQLQLLHIL